MVETRLRWSGHVERRFIDFVARRVDQVRIVRSLEAAEDLEQLLRETINKDLESNELDQNIVYDRVLWCNFIHVSSLT